MRRTKRTPDAPAVRWEDLLVMDTSRLNPKPRTLESLLKNPSPNISNLRIADGKPQEFPGFYIYAKTETPGPDTPQVPVDWGGFAEAVLQAKYVR